MYCKLSRHQVTDTPLADRPVSMVFFRVYASRPSLAKVPKHAPKVEGSDQMLACRLHVQHVDKGPPKRVTVFLEGESGAATEELFVFTPSTLSVDDFQQVRFWDQTDGMRYIFGRSTGPGSTDLDCTGTVLQSLISELVAAAAQADEGSQRYGTAEVERVIGLPGVSIRPFCS